MSKKNKSKKQPKNNSEVEVAIAEESMAQENEEVLAQEVSKEEQALEVKDKKDNKKDNKKEKDNKKNKKNSQKNVKEKGSLKKKAKETVSELKKVIWPSFGEVVKKTGVVLVVVIVFAIVIFGIDYGLGALVNLLKR